jgi:lysophospholipase L1-like esterase
MSGRLVALGDSFSCGVGVGLEIPHDETWVGLLGVSLGLGVELHASPGMAAGEVLRDQVPAATARRAEVATLLVGLNDIVRSAFDPAATGTHISSIVDTLCAAHDVVLVVRLHDAVARLPIPRRVRCRYVGRIAEVNMALDVAVARHANAVLLDLAEIAPLRAACAWAVDRIHPSRYGHHAVASAALDALRSRRAPVIALVAAEVPAAPASLLDEIGWFVAHGGPWLARRLPKVVYGRARNGDGRAEIDPVEPYVGRRPAGREEFVHR